MEKNKKRKKNSAVQKLLKGKRVISAFRKVFLISYVWTKVDFTCRCYTFLLQ